MIGSSCSSPGFPQASALPPAKRLHRTFCSILWEFKLSGVFPLPLLQLPNQSASCVLDASTHVLCVQPLWLAHSYLLCRFPTNCSLLLSGSWHAHISHSQIHYFNSFLNQMLAALYLAPECLRLLPKMAHRGLQYISTHCCALHRFDPNLLSNLSR